MSAIKRAALRRRSSMAAPRPPHLPQQFGAVKYRQPLYGRLDVVPTLNSLCDDELPVVDFHLTVTAPSPLGHRSVTSAASAIKRAALRHRMAAPTPRPLHFFFHSPGVLNTDSRCMGGRVLCPLSTPPVIMSCRWWSSTPQCPFSNLWGELGSTSTPKGKESTPRGPGQGQGFCRGFSPPRQGVPGGVSTPGAPGGFPSRDLRGPPGWPRWGQNLPEGADRPTSGAGQHFLVV